jgi:hypothetical protein
MPRDPLQAIDPDRQQVVLDDGIQDKRRFVHQELATHDGTVRIVHDREAGLDQVLRRPPQLLLRLIEELLVVRPGAVLPPEREVTLETAIQIALQGFPGDLLAHDAWLPVVVIIRVKVPGPVPGREARRSRLRRARCDVLDADRSTCLG